jgi:aspartate carbamoyltransferase catalytic subunit
VTKGETLIDTARNLEAMGIDIVVIRHTAPGAPHILASVLDASVINAGDGSHEHPTQALLDIYTIREKKGRVAGLTVAIVGDISHSRAARSNIWGLTKLGARVIVVGPSTLIPSQIGKMGVEACYHLDDILGEADVINLLRVQTERLESSPFPSVREYARLFGMNSARMTKAKKDVLIMAPGPINRGVEITPDVADGANSVILEQVANGLAVRMAVLYLVSGKQPDKVEV